MSLLPGPLTICWGVAIVLFSLIARPLEVYLRQTVAEEGIAVLLWSIAIVGVLGVIKFLLRDPNRITTGQLLRLAGLIAFGFALFSKQSITAERVHIILFGTLGALVASDNRHRNGVVQTTSALVAGTLVAALDEWLQLHIPDRVADIRDIWLGTISSILGGAFGYCIFSSPSPQQSKPQDPPL